MGFEDLGSFAGPPAKVGYDIKYVDAATDDLCSIDPLDVGTLSVLGGLTGRTTTLHTQDRYWRV